MSDEKQPEQAGELPRHWEDLHQLEGALHSYHAWLEDTHRRLICALPPNPNDLELDAHRRCDFGKWYYSREQAFSDHQASFDFIGQIHQEMHDGLRNLLNSVKAGKPPTPAEYDAFINKSLAFNNELRSLQFEMLSEHYQSDPLTNALSRHSMMSRLRQEQSRTHRDQSRCVICMLDFDHFKNINDSYGHLAGDEVLKESVHRIKQDLREYDLIFRYGGEEFLICLPNTSMEEALEIAQRIHETVQQQPVLTRDGKEISATVTMGLAELGTLDSIETCIANADQALLTGKNMGRNRITVWPGHKK